MLSPISRRLSGKLAICLVLISSLACAHSRSVVIPDPPGIPGEVIDEAVSGMCPATTEWLFDEYAPFMLGLKAMGDGR